MAQDYIEFFECDGHHYGITRSNSGYEGWVSGCRVEQDYVITKVRAALVALADARSERMIAELQKRIARLDIMRARIARYQPQRKIPASWQKELVP